MEGQSDANAAPRRWTCEACGCNTNVETDRTCSICGTSSGPSLLRRAGYAARSGLIARSFAARREMAGELGPEDDDLWDRVVEDVEIGGDEDEQAIAALAMEVAGVSGAASGAAARIRNSRQHFLEAARSFAMATRESQRPNSDEVFRAANDNASHCQPKWAEPSRLVGRVCSGNSIEVGGGEHQNIAHVPATSGEGRALRAQDALPRGAAFAAFNQDRRQRRTFGFRVAFDHPHRDEGSNLGGSYLIGVTASSFSAFGERNGLQQTPFFWGIEDCGNKYEGSRYSHSSRPGRRGPASFAAELTPHEAPRNAAGVLFGAKDIVTVVVDFETRTLTFWRNDQLLGTLVANLPRSGNLFPIVVPSSPGTTVAITGMDGDPLALLRVVASDWKQAQQEMDEQCRRKLAAERSVLIQDGRPTPELTNVLRGIFSGYEENTEGMSFDSTLALDYVAAARLWYRCGLKLSSLDSLVEKPSVSTSPNNGSPAVSFDDFLNLIVRIIQEDEEDGTIPVRSSERSSSEPFQEGDKVELVDGYEGYGDASGGPLQPGDIGVVVEIQHAPTGHLIGVTHNGRRWWYQPRALLRKKRGLGETPGVSFLRNALRAHGHDHISLHSLVGKQVTSTSWQVGDIVIPKKRTYRRDSNASNTGRPMDSCVGRITAETSSSPASLSARGRDSGAVLVEYVDKSFGDAAGVLMGGSAPDETRSLETRRVRVNRLVHSSVFHGCNPIDKGLTGIQKDASQAENCDDTAADAMDIGNTEQERSGGDSRRAESQRQTADIKAISQLDISAIESTTKECGRNGAALAMLFSAGLPDAIIAAFEQAEERLDSVDESRSLPQAIEALGGLAALVAEKLFSEKAESVDANNDEMPAELPTQRPAAASVASSSGDEDSDETSRRLAIRRHIGNALGDAAGIRSFRMGDRGSLQDIGPAGRLPSLQQRQNMLLTLMSRSRRADSGAAEFLFDSGSVPTARDFAGQIMPPFGSFRQDAPASFIFGPFGELSQRGRMNNPASNSDETEARLLQGSERPRQLPRRSTPPDVESPTPRSQASGRQAEQAEASFLESVLRGLGPDSSCGAAHLSTSAKAIIHNGLLNDSFGWVVGAVESQRRKVLAKSTHAKANALQNVADEEGTSLLMLAVSFGCSDDILRHLIQSGSIPGEAEIKKAALTNQPLALSALLDWTVYRDGMVDLDRCSPAVVDVLRGAEDRQKDREKRMREEARTFMAQLLRLLFRLCLRCRRQKSSHDNVCSRSISSVIVGNVLLSALHSRQQAVTQDRGDRLASTRNGGDQAENHGRFPFDGGCSEAGLPSKGILKMLPRVILKEAFLGDVGHFRSFMLMVEDHLCSKDINDLSIGFTLLSSFLSSFPYLSLCPEIERYGINELVSSHDLWAAAKLAEITSCHGSRDEDGSSSAMQGTSSSVERPQPVPGCQVIQCPKKHTAILHVTRHSSFRCDICGKGVERGRAMHGCRECDWDACEDCTDKAEGGAVKWTHIRELTSECQQLLSREVTDYADCPDPSDWIEKFLEDLVAHDNSSELSLLASRLLQRDAEALKQLANLLKMPGDVTVHQFLTMVLPSLHASLVGRSSNNLRVNCSHMGFGPRNKKPRVVVCSFPSGANASRADHEGRVPFCLSAVKLLVGDGQLAEKVDNEDDKAGAPRRVDADNESDDGMDDQDRPSATKAMNTDAESPELLRRLHQVLSLYESVSVIQNDVRRGEKAGSMGSQSGDLQSLTRAVDIQLCPSAHACGTSIHSLGLTSLSVRAEPLMLVNDLELHILRTCRITHPSYVLFCKRLALDRAVIIERPLDFGSSRGQRRWRVARIISFDEDTGTHCVRYASRRKSSGAQNTATMDLGSVECLESLDYEGRERSLRLAVREYCVLFRTSNFYEDDHVKSSVNMERIVSETVEEIQISSSRPSIGTRVESSCGSADGSWAEHTIIGVAPEIPGQKRGDLRFKLVSDDGEVFCDVAPSQIRGLAANSEAADSSVNEVPGAGFPPGRGRDGRNPISRTFPFFTARRQFSPRADSRGASESTPQMGTLKRCWSALSPIESMCPVELKASESGKPSGDRRSSNILWWPALLGEFEVDFFAERHEVEIPPQLRVKFSSHDALPGVDLRGATIISALWRLQRREDSVQGPMFQVGQLVKLFYSITSESKPKEKDEESPWLGTLNRNESLSDAEGPKIASFSNAGVVTSNDACAEAFLYTDESRCALSGNRSRKLSLTSYPDEDEACFQGICDGLDDVCVQCIELIGLLADFSEGPALSNENAKGSPKGSMFENRNLSKKLVKQLDDPLLVVGGALPDWCTLAPSFAPRVFSYDARRLLLERTAFGVSRSAFRLQEAKVNVGRLRQRMAALRGRAVELVGEAFSGGAEDPTALQLQADELYGMEEALAARVKAAFRAVKWEEHALQVAKAAVRRDNLLEDAAMIMQRYANDDFVCRRRLEVRFDGESGFDLASGDEAGVTRGFYADVAEALLSCENVRGVNCASPCSPISRGASYDKSMQIEEIGTNNHLKLPLWIPDMDSKHQVVIPTPRADPRSGPGVYPHPLSADHPQFDQVMVRFRFMGQLFAAAMRDGFMFPLPLCSAFLKLVQHGGELTNNQNDGWTRTTSHFSPIVASSSTDIDERSSCAHGSRNAREFILTSADLPRPGFLGGEVCAVEMHICRALDLLDESNPPLSQADLDERYSAIARDKNFARNAFGKTFDYSFEDFFQDKTFVDPLDPTQGEQAAPLCPNGHQRPVTIHNVREWVSLAKGFILHHGVMAQAHAFRRGVEDFFSADYLRLFTPEELQRDVCGVGDNVDSWDDSAIRQLFKLDGGKGAAEALVAVAAIGGEGGAALSRRFGPSSPTVTFLVKSLLEASPKQRRQFLSFVTSVPIVTPGRIEVVPMVSPSGEFLPMRDPGCLPRANTCARRLYLPKFETFESFSQVLWAVVEEESKFKGFYEWRGS